MASLGIDIGTTSIKICIVDNASSRILISKRANHSTFSEVKLNEDIYSEQSGLHILKKVDECMEDVAKTIREGDAILRTTCCNVTSVVITGQMHGVVLWSRMDQSSTTTTTPKTQTTSFEQKWIKDMEKCIKLESNLITWEDKRCSCEFIRSLPPSKTQVHTGYGCATLFWLNKYRNTVIKFANCAGSIMDLLVFYICNLVEPIMSDQIANSWGYYDKETSSWQHDLLSQFAFPVKLLPEVRSAGSSAGFVSRDWHFIPKGTSVKVATGDFQCSFLSACGNGTTAVINIGTSAQLAVKVTKPFDVCNIDKISKAINFVPYFKKCQLAVAASLNGGNVLDQFVSMLVSWQQDLELPHIDAESMHTRISEFLSKSRAKDGDCLKIIATLNGERHDMSKSAHVLNIRPDNISLINIIHQIYVGIITNLFEMMPLSLLKELGIKQISCSGSVFSTNNCMKCLVETISGLPCIIASDAGASYGAAISGFPDCAFT